MGFLTKIKEIANPMGEAERDANSDEPKRKTIEVCDKRVCNTKISFILMPFGAIYNRNLATASKGDMLLFADGLKGIITFVGQLKMSLSTTDALCQLRYGKPIMRKLKEWRRDAVYLGNSRAAVDKDNCLLITYTNYDEDTNKVCYYGSHTK